MKSLGNVPIKKGIFDSKSLKMIERAGKPCVFRDVLKQNITLYLFDFLKFNELSNFCCANVFLHNCFIEYEKSTLRNIIDTFHLDIKNQEIDIDETLSTCMKKNHIYPIENIKENYLRINKEGIHLISLVYYDPDMQEQLEKSKTLNKESKTIEFDFEAQQQMDLEDDFDTNNHHNMKTPWISFYSKHSYIPGNIIYLEEKSTLDFSFSFHHVIKDDYKLYLHQSMTDMRNAKLRLQIIINDELIIETPKFPSKKVLEQSYLKRTDDIKLYDVYICDINKYMFESVENDLKKSIESNNDLKTSVQSDKSTESNTFKSANSNKSISSIISLQSQNNVNDFEKNKSKDNEFTVKIRFINTHLLWKAGWYLDGGKLVKSIYKI